MTVLHELARFVADAANTAPSPDSSHEVVTALIGAAAPLLLALVALLTTLRSRDRATVPGPPPAGPLNSHADEEQEDVLRAVLHRYETFLWRHHINPNKIVTGDEAMTDVRFE